MCQRERTSSFLWPHFCCLSLVPRCSSYVFSSFVPLSCSLLNLIVLCHPQFHDLGEYQLYLSRSTYEKSCNLNGEVENNDFTVRKQLAQESLDSAENALKKMKPEEPENKSASRTMGMLYKQLGKSLSLVGKYEGIRKQIQNGLLFKVGILF